MQRGDGEQTWSARDHVIAMIVEHALDDLEAAHVDLQTVLTLTARTAWEECERVARRSGVIACGPGGEHWPVPSPRG